MGLAFEALRLWLTGAPPTGVQRDRSPPSTLTERELDVLRLLGEGRTNREIARALVLSNKTVEHHLDHIYNKLGVSCRTAAVVFAVHHGLVS
jgi:DNA-binding NarL/FixJ family response regulator